MSRRFSTSDFARPEYYAQKILERYNVKHPPVSEKVIAKNLGLRIRTYSEESLARFTQHASLDMQEAESVRKSIGEARAWLKREKNGGETIWVKKELREEVQRTDIFHEFGHEILPWHRDLNYLCDENDILSARIQKNAESEAFEAGMELLMPREMFANAARRYDTGIAAIEGLCENFVTTLEATAIRYVQFHPGFCGMAILEPLSQQKKLEDRRNAVATQTVMPLNWNNDTINLAPSCEDPLAVRYFVSSPRLRKFFKKGTIITSDNPIYESWTKGISVKGRMPMSIFGSSDRTQFNVECKPFTRLKKVMALLWCVDSQNKLEI